tara:strand:- start:8823 stop:9419 length:597 start_codon:yes stop_codon:yes gene_type:complete
MIGNIISSNELKVDENFNVVDSMDKAIDGLPTLIIGLDNVRKIETDLNFVDRKLSDNTYWTFNKQERRVLFEEDLFYFIENSYKFIKENIEYIFIDFVLFSDNKINKVFNRIKESNNNISFLHNKMMYIYTNDFIFGIDLRQIEFMGYNVDSFLKKIKNLSKVFLDNDEILIEYKNKLGMLEDEVKYIPLLYSINKNE